MNRWFTKLAMVLLPSFVVSFAPVNADVNDPCCVDPCFDPCPCDPCDNWCDGYIVGVDFIWWKPCIDDLDYAVQFDFDVDATLTPTTGRYRYVEPCWEPGVRAYLEKKDLCWCGWDLYADYTWIHVHERDSTGGVGNFAAPTNTLFSTEFHPNFITTTEDWDELSTKYRLKYQTFNVLLETECCFCNCSYVTPFFGLTGVFLNQKRDTHGLEGNGVIRDDLRWRNSYWGIGFRAGAEYTCELCDCFSFFASASGAIVAGDSESERIERHDVLGTPRVREFDSDDECLFLNGYHFAAGFVYSDCFCCWDYEFRIGYEFVKWTNVPTMRRYISNQLAEIGTTPSHSTTTLGFHGLLLGLAVAF